ncbi:Uncharacterised protein [Mycobacteroides abscessus subsp. abscessus]|nr:Uncharacterised protein [Mycobacteroides abscessus subsp. abscessus]
MFSTPSSARVMATATVPGETSLLAGAASRSPPIHTGRYNANRKATPRLISPTAVTLGQGRYAGAHSQNVVGGLHGAATVFPAQTGACLGRAAAAACSRPHGTTATWMAPTTYYAVSGISGASAAARVPGTAGAPGISTASRVRTAPAGARQISHRPDHRRRVLRAGRDPDAGNGGGVVGPSGLRRAPPGAGDLDMAVFSDLDLDQPQGDTPAATARPSAGLRARRQPFVPGPGGWVHQCALLNEHMAV